MQPNKNTSPPQPVLVIGLSSAYQRTIRFANLRVGEVNRATHTAISAAGKGVNVARALHMLDVPTELMTFLGSTTGAWIRQRLADEGIACLAIPTAAPTRICQTLVDEQQGQITELVEEMTPPTAREWAPFQVEFAQALERVSLVVVAGTMPPGASATLYGEFARQAQAHGVPFFIDSHGAPLWAALPFAPCGVKCNREELARTVNMELTTDAQLVEAGHRLLEAGAESVLITDGPERAWWFEGETIHTLSPPAIHPVNPIGSGDAVTAGWVAGRQQGLGKLAAARQGIACGTANALTDLPGHFDSLRVRALMDAVEVSVYPPTANPYAGVATRVCF